MSLTFKATGCQALAVDVPVRWSGFLERGRPRPLNLPLMQAQPVMVFGLKGEQDVFTILTAGAASGRDVRAPVNPTTFTVGIQDHYKQSPHL